MRPHRGRQECGGAQAVIEMRMGEYHGARLPGDLAHRRMKLSALARVASCVHYQAMVTPDQ
jgi:hypothetical protein